MLRQIHRRRWIQLLRGLSWGLSRAFQRVSRKVNSFYDGLFPKLTFLRSFKLTNNVVRVSQRYLSQCFRSKIPIQCTSREGSRMNREISRIGLLWNKVEYVCLFFALFGTDRHTAGERNGRSSFVTDDLNRWWREYILKFKQVAYMGDSWDSMSVLVL